LTELTPAVVLIAHHGRERKATVIRSRMLRHHIEKLEDPPYLLKCLD
jgi:hypothetical protein